MALIFGNIISRAEVAQLVEHNLAKVGVAGSNPVFRSIESFKRSSIRPYFTDESIFFSSVLSGFKRSAMWPSGKAEACKAFIPGSNPGIASKIL